VLIIYQIIKVTSNNNVRIEQPLLFREDSLKKRAFQVLRLEPKANVSEIKKQFRKLSLKYHPDRTKASAANRKMQLIVQAYELLTKKTYIDPSKYKILEDDQLIFTVLPKGTKIEPLRPTYEEWNKKQFYGQGAL
jgi:curved DNA-binding protein CbpA